MVLKHIVGIQNSISMVLFDTKCLRRHCAYLSYGFIVDNITRRKSVLIQSLYCQKEYTVASKKLGKTFDIAKFMYLR